MLPLTLPHQETAHWVFAYGSNMHLADVKRWFGARAAPFRIDRVERAELHDHRLVWNYYSRARRGGAANVARRVGTSVWGAALLVDSHTVRGLDRKEGHPHLYRRELGWLRVDRAGWVHAWIYRVGARHTRQSFTAPTAHYKSLLVAGAAQLQLPQSYHHALRRLPTR
jgi:gamma-glutamylcyclotransferase (GGCT)/AIG2-like uncharacterized protein YtfP